MSERELPPEFVKQMQRSHAMGTASGDERIRQFWQWWNERTPGRLDFMLNAFVSWKTDRETELGLPAGGSLRPTPYEPVRAGPPFEIPMKGYSEFGGGMAIQDLDETNAEAARFALAEAIGRIDLLTDCLSCLTGFATWWQPARILRTNAGGTRKVGPPSTYRRYHGLTQSDESVSTVVDDRWFENLFAPVLRALHAMTNSRVREALATAISWQAEGNRVRGFGRYVHYWASVELVANYLYEHSAHAVLERKTAADKKRLVLEHLLDLNSRNYMEIVQKCADLQRPSARTKIKAVGKLIDFDTNVFFQRPNRGSGLSMLGIRNDIAHGNVARGDIAFAESNAAQLEEFPKATREFVLRAIVTPLSVGEAGTS
jgi:hypothetical protein